MDQTTTDLTVLRAIKHKILVHRDAPIVQTDGGIFIPPQCRIVPWTGTALSCGELCDTVKKGDRVLIAQFTGEFVHDDRMLVCVSERDILAVVDGDEKIDLVSMSQMFGGPGQIDPGIVGP